MLDTHVSIDLDYWTDHWDPAWKQDSMAVWRKLIDYMVPTTVVRHHHRAVRYVTKGCSRLINVDEHSDYPMAMSSLHCGSWASPQFLPFVREYTWYSNGEGCDCAIYNAAHTVKFRKLSHKRVEWIAKSINWESVAECTICLSPDYANRRTEYVELRKTVTHLFGAVK
jgi:hypothetical protein